MNPKVNQEKDKIFARNPFTLKGEEWKDKRAEIAPAFSNNRVSCLVDTSFYQLIDVYYHYYIIEIRCAIGNRKSIAYELLFHYVVELSI